MFSEELTTYLYSYNMPKKEEAKDNEAKTETPKLPILNILKKAYATAPIHSKQ